MGPQEKHRRYSPVRQAFLILRFPTIPHHFKRATRPSRHVTLCPARSLTHTARACYFAPLPGLSIVLSSTRQAMLMHYALEHL